MKVKLHDEHEINIEIFNARNLLLSCQNKLVKISRENEIITNLEFSDGFHIELGDLFPIISDCDTKTMYTIKDITQLDDNTYRISCNIINKTSHWLLPFIAKDEIELGYDTCLINAFAFTTDNIYSSTYEKGYLFLKYRYLKEYDFFLNKLKDHQNCTLVNRIYSRYEYLYIFKIPEQWMNDVNLIINGKYSQISENAKKRILAFHKLTKTGRTGDILYKNDKYADELKERFNLPNDFDIPELESNFEDLKINETLV